MASFDISERSPLMTHSNTPSCHAPHKRAQQPDASYPCDDESAKMVQKPHTDRTLDVLHERMQRVREAMDALDGLIERARELSHDSHPTRKESLS
ncbi:MAG: hypothetical protein D6690_01355 [Nitrospirae bacterium]|nr:MAG: hypothetical protein D6690_01355 [Nitrospirota bacterium]